MTDLAQMERKLHGYQVVLWLKQTYLVAEDEEGDDNTAPAYWSKNSVYKAYLEMCHTNDLVAMFTRPVVGKMVKRAFPDVRTKRRGRRGNVKQHYIGLQPVRKKSLGQQLPPTPPAPIQETSRQQVATLVPKAAEEYSWPASVDAANDQCPTPGLSGSGEWHSLAYPVHRTASSFSSPSSSTGAESPFLLCAPYLPSTLQVPTAGRGCVGVTLESLESQWDWGQLNSVQVAQPLLEEKGEIRTAEEAPSDLEDSGRLSLAEELAWKRGEEGEEDIGSVLTWADQVVDTYPWQLT